MIGAEDGEETDAAREARLCGAMDMTGTFLDATSAVALEERKLRTSLWDCRVIKTDSADVMQPLA